MSLQSQAGRHPYKDGSGEVKSECVEQTRAKEGSQCAHGQLQLEDYENKSS